MTIEYDHHLKMYSVFHWGDELLFTTEAEAQAFIDHELELPF